MDTIFVVLRDSLLLIREVPVEVLLEEKIDWEVALMPVLLFGMFILGFVLGKCSGK